MGGWLKSKIQLISALLGLSFAIKQEINITKQYHTIYLLLPTLPDYAEWGP